VFEVGLQSACEEINEAFSKGNLARVDNLLWPAIDQFSEIPQLWFYAGNLSFRMGKCALASVCFERALELDDNPLVRSNLGAAYRRLNRHEDGLAVLRSTIERYPDYEPALVNYGAMYVNEGTPNEGIPALERAVKLGREKGKLETGAEWNLGLLYLEAARFGEGFDIYRNGYGAERLVRAYAHGEVQEPKRLEHADHNLVKARRALA
jgi:tetratricopeptide (TPR) repeat protein